MYGILRQIVALVCLAALLCGGQLSVCACEIAPPPAACGGHDHSHESEHDHSEPGSAASCPCVACHSCHHAQVVLPADSMVSGNGLPTAVAVEVAAAPVMRSADIFDPPKLG